MPKIERRRREVTLYQGHYEAELTALMDAMMDAARAEEVAQRRAGTKSKSMQFARKYDELVAEAEASAVKVTVWAIRYDLFGDLADAHPPRTEKDDDGRWLHPDDQVRGVNAKTFPTQLLFASLAPEDAKRDSVDDLIAAGKLVFEDLGDVSQLHFVKLREAAWAVNVQDDELPKVSAVSLLKEAREHDSKQPDDGE